MHAVFLFFLHLFRKTTSGNKCHSKNVKALKEIYTESRRRKLTITVSPGMLVSLMSGRGRGLATPRMTRPRGAPFSAWTASSSDAFSSRTLLTNISLSPGTNRPSSCAAPPGTKLRIMITVSIGFNGSCTHKHVPICTCTWSGDVSQHLSTHPTAWPSGVTVKALDLQLKRSRIQLPTIPLLAKDPGKIVYTHVPPSPSATIWHRSKDGHVLRVGKVNVGVALHWPSISHSNWLMQSIHLWSRSLK